MTKRKILPQELAAAGVLATLTLFVFFTLRDFGPGSAVRRFHEDLLSVNLNDFQRVSTEPVTSPNVIRIAEFLRVIEESGANARLASMDRSPNEVDVLVLYQLNGAEHPFVWVVDKKEIGWQVDPYQTLLANPSLENG